MKNEKRIAIFVFIKKCYICIREKGITCVIRGEPDRDYASRDRPGSLGKTKRKKKEHRS